jgi:NAD(P)-dependent dehydrogenase (short-subunit alcohol dehydrogenase family)
LQHLLKDHVIVISGGTKGVGRAVAEECARQGGSVVIGGRDEMAGKNTVKLINTYKQKGLFVHTELTRTEDCKKLFEETMAKFGKLDGFLNYAGLTSVSPLDTCSEATYNAVMETNLRAAFFCCQNAVRCMRLNKGKGGSIVLVGSAHAWGGQIDRAAYALSKGALITLNEHIAHNYATEQIRCNYLTLGWTPTESEVALRNSQGITEAELRMNAAKVIPMGRMLERSDYVQAVVYLFSDYSAMMTGANLRITGGEYI